MFIINILINIHNNIKTLHYFDNVSFFQNIWKITPLQDAVYISHVFKSWTQQTSEPFYILFTGLRMLLTWFLGN